MAQKTIRHKKALNVYVDPDLIDWLDDWIAAQELRPNKTALVEMLLRRFREDTEKKKAPSPKARG